ncbi:hypothetical protein QOT17_025347 [Balamuthia mandrillaris]
MGAGKTSFGKRFAFRKFQEHNYITVSTDYVIRQLHLQNGMCATTMLWDPAGLLLDGVILVLLLLVVLLLLLCYCSFSQCFIEVLSGLCRYYVRCWRGNKVCLSAMTAPTRTLIPLWRSA